MRDILSQFLTSKAEENESLYVFSGDHGYALFDELLKSRPKQFINTGVSEQAMIGYAAGMAKEGMKSIVYGLSAFIPIRVLEFIKMDVCYESLPVIFLGDGAGLVYATLGPSHQCAEDISAIRALPNITVLSPADAIEMKACLEYAYSINSPTYVRIGKADKQRIHTSDLENFSPKLIELINLHGDSCIVATGSMVDTGSRLAQKYKMSLFSAPFLHPLDTNTVYSQIKKFKTIISLEEHSVYGGLGSILAEIVSENSDQAKIRIVRIGITNRFTKYCGSYEYAIKEHELDIDSIESRLIRMSII